MRPRDDRISNPRLAGSARDRFKVIDLAPQTASLCLRLSARLSDWHPVVKRRRRGGNIFLGSGISTYGDKAAVGSRLKSAS